MDKTKSNAENLVFGLDIGTRSVVGVVGFMERDVFNITAMAEEKHQTRAMIDGQIHDIYKVGDTIRDVKNKLEAQLDMKMSDVCIAAAGRVLKTVEAEAQMNFEEEIRVDAETIYSLNLLAVEKAYNIINDETGGNGFYCVGSTPIDFTLNDYDCSNLEGHKAHKIGVHIIATFLPNEVVDGLNEAVEYAGLQVASLTLEPIAAMNIAIPEKYRLLNIALIDVGAGTSDICITKSGSIVAYGMIPFAGDELTEVIAQKYLVDFNTAENIKINAGKEDATTVTFEDIMGLEQTVSVDDVIETTKDVVDKMAKAAADKIIELNGNKPVNAVFVVGGGGKISGYTEKVASFLGIDKTRVAIRGKEVLTTVNFPENGFTKDSLYVTPVGICTNYYTQKNSFIFVNVNDERVKLYDNSHLTVVDALMQVGFPNEKLFPRRGSALEFTVNDKARLIRGTRGDAAVITLNGYSANLNSSIVQNDMIKVTESTVGEDASLEIGQLEDYKSSICFVVNDKKVVCPKFAYVNGELKSEFYDIHNGDVIKMENFYTVAQLFEFLDYDISTYDVYVNNEKADKDTKVYENFSVKTQAISNDTPLENFEEEVSEIKKQAEELSENNHTYVSDTDASGNGYKSDNAIDNAADNATETEKENAQAEKNTSNLLHDIVILINGEPVKLTGKKNYILVDLFQYYDFDLSKPHGNIVLNLNGKTGEYTAPLNDGDVVDLYWEGTKNS